MKPLSNKLKRSIRALVIATISMVIFVAFGNLLNTEWMGAENIVSEHIQFSDLYFRLHAHTDPPTYDGRGVYVLDIHQYQSREELADLFEKLAEAKPYLVALDIIFSSHSDTDTSADQSLTEAVQKLPNLIIARAVQDEKLIQSFFDYDLLPH